MRQETPHNKRYITRFNRELFDGFPDSLFDPAEAGRTGAPSAASGRGSVVSLTHAGLDLVLKRYQRGGYPRHFIRDSYLFFGLRRTRMWREFTLLQKLRQLDLPVPVPAAVRCERTSPLSYRGQLITQWIPATVTLADRLAMAPLAPASWSEVGRVIARFHRNAVYHADLNARNILLNSAGQVFLIDFDKGRIRPRHRHRWAPSNLKRLLRSLNKCKRLNPRLCFSEADWACLLEGYES